MHRAHKIRLYPTKEQAVQMLKTVGVARYAYNWALARWEEEYKKGNKPSSFKLDAIWSKERPTWAR
jgi:putative transposase